MIQIAKLSLGSEEKEAISHVLDSGMIANGEVVKDFETAFADYCGVSYGIATTSGTTALEVAIRAAGLGAGDKIVTTPFSFIASTNSIIYAGATPVFADIDPDTFNIDLDRLGKVLENDGEIKAVLIVHLFGRPCDMDRLQQIVDKYDVKLIEDCAQAVGTEWKGKRVGSFGAAAAFSFYPTKNMTTGEGGIVVTNDANLAEKARLLINHGMKVRYYHDIVGYNYRMTNIAAAIGLCQLKKLPEMNRKRFENAKYYCENIKNPIIKVPGLIEGHSYHQFTLQVEKGMRDAFVSLLQAEEVGFGIFYPLSIPEQNCYKDYNFNIDYPVTDEIKTKVVSIPIHPLLTADELKKVTEVINGFHS